MNYLDFLQQNKYVFIVMGLAVIGSVVYYLVRMGGIKSSNKRFLAEHPDAVGIYLTTRALHVVEAVTISAVDGERPQYFAENGKIGFYVVPGKHLVEMSYTHTRPALIRRSVTTTFGPAKKELTVEAQKKYLLSFDRGEETFTFAEW
jgi:hypothetical protein